MNRPRGFLVLIAVSFFASGLVEAALELTTQAPNEVSAVHAVVLAALGFWWCKADIETRGVPVPISAAFLVAMLSVVGCFFYFFRSRSRRAALIATGVMVVFILGCEGLFYLGGLVGGLV